jgi:CopG family transcriptional regulator / antitoxin EndoAI
VYVVSELNTKRIVISLPQKLLSEVDRVIKKENLDRSEFIHQATEMFLRERKNKRQFRDEMRQGYMEMAKINLTIASEAFLLEEEADHTLDRLVSGV